MCPVGDGEQGAGPVHRLGHRPRHAARSEEEHGARIQRAQRAVRPDGHVGLQRIEGCLVVGVVSGKTTFLAHQRVGRPGQLDRLALLVRQGRRRFLVRDGHAVAADRDGVEALEKTRQVGARHTAGEVDGVQAQAAVGRVVDKRAQAMPHRVADDAVDRGVGIDVVEAVDVL